MASPLERAINRDRSTERLRNQITALRQWSIDANAIATNAGTPSTAQIKALFDRFGKLCDGVVDLLIAFSVDQ